MPAYCRTRFASLAPLIILGLLASCGCRPWAPAKEEVSRLPSFRMNPDSIALEIALANIRIEDAARLDELWRTLDEQAISVESRRVLDLNGFRCGIASTHMPAIFRELVDRENDSNNAPALVGHQLVQNGYGEFHPLEVGPTQAKLLWSLQDLEGRVRTGSCENATCLFELQTFAMGNGTAEIKLHPKIAYGQPKPKLASENNSFALRPLRDEIGLAELVFECRLKPGETLIVGPTHPAAGLGKSFLTDEQSDAGVVRLLLIRLARTQWDDLFSPPKKVSPLGTSTF